MELHNLASEPSEEWRRLLRFVNISSDERSAMIRSSEVLINRGQEFVINTYDYLNSVPETAAILGWERGIDEQHLEERRRFFTMWLNRTLGVDTSDEFAYYLFRSGQYHAGHGPRHIHTPTPYVTTSIGLTLAAFAHYMGDANLPSEVVASAMAGWTKYLSVQLNQMALGYDIARDFETGDATINFSTFGRMRPIVDNDNFEMHANLGDLVRELLRKFFNYYPHARLEALDRIWISEEKEDSLWIEVNPAYILKHGWRILLNGRDLEYAGGFDVSVQDQDSIAIFPPGR